ncbi:MAG: 16S rRNA (cytosine(967)-C(5))-methyltransferase RsmB [Eubacteriales bacterium]|nr:16S rRNA (cytosine(967)-C(5))-methyltransferase RsmB [Eubacteriales bacterium]
MTVVIDEARKVAVLVLQDVLESGAYANLSSITLLENKQLTARDRAFASALIYGTISYLPAIDYLLSQVLDKSLDRMQPAVRTILRLGAWQLYYAHAIPPSAAVDESVKLTHLLANQGASTLVNACLRRLAAADRPILPANKPHLAVGLPPELFGYFKKWYGVQIATEIGRHALESRNTVTVRVNRLRSSVEAVAHDLEESGIKCQPGLYCPDALRLHLQGQSIRSLDAWQQGLITVQDEAAMLVGYCAAPEPGQQILDLCAAPGGKSTHLAEITQDQSRIIALDVSASRVPLIDDLVHRLGIQSIRTAVADALSDDWSADLLGQVDLVLADVPCSGLGLLGRKPEIRLNMTHEKMQGLYPIQSQILEHAAQLVKPGGHLIYSTCTINPVENQEQIIAFLAQAGADFMLESLTDLIPAPLLQFADIQETAKLGFIQLLPHLHHTDGFFIARLRRKNK